MAQSVAPEGTVVETGAMAVVVAASGAVLVVEALVAAMVVA